MTIHETLEVWFFALVSLLNHLIELGHHVFHGRQIFGLHLSHSSSHLIKLALSNFFFQSLNEFVKLLSGFGR